MSKSWNHTMFLYSRPHDTNGEPIRCTARRHCPRPIRYRIAYDYVTGRKGRVSSAARTACFEHALQFARDYKIDIPKAAPLEMHDWKATGETHGKLETCLNCKAWREKAESEYVPGLFHYKSDENLECCPPAARKERPEDDAVPLDPAARLKA